MADAHPLPVERWLPWAVLGVAALVAVLLYRPGLAGGFVFDDFPNLVEPGVLQEIAAGGSPMQALGSSPASATGRPLSMASFALQVWLTGSLEPGPLKLGNLILHLVIGLLLLLVLRRLRAALPPAHQWPEALEGLTVAAWLLAAGQVSTVLYVVQRMEMLAAAAVVLGLWAYLRLRAPLSSSWPRLLGLGATLGVIAVAGALAKEHALLLPVFCALAELVLLRGHGLPPEAARRLRQAALGLVVIPFLLGYLGLVAWGLALAPFEARSFGAWERLLAQGPVLIHHLEQTLLPRPGLFPFYYDYLEAPRGLLEPPGTALAWLLLLALGTGAVMLRCRRPWLAFGIGWFFLGHAITAAPLPLELAFEHRNYLPSFGLVVALADLLALAAATLNRPLVAAGALAAWTLWQAAVAATLALDWRDPLVHAEACRQRAPESARAHYEFARLLYPASEGLAPEASPRREMREALLLAARLPSGTGLAEVALIGDAGRHGEPTEAWWWDSLARRLSGRGVAVSQNRAVADLAKCVFERRCAADDPGLARLVRVRLGTGPWVRDDALLLGWIAYRVLQDWEAAAMQLERAEAEGGLDPNSRLALADALVRLGDEAAARALLERHGVPYVALEGFRMAVWVLPAAVEPSPDQGGGHPPP